MEKKDGVMRKEEGEAKEDKVGVEFILGETKGEESEWEGCGKERRITCDFLESSNESRS